MRTDWVGATIALAVGLVLVFLAGMLPAPLVIGYVFGIILAVVGGILLLVKLVRGAA